jgi:hypothetical protein
MERSKFMEVKRKVLQEALQRCMPGVETGKTLLEGADTFIFSGGKIYSYNDSISVAVPSPVDLTGAVKAKDLYDLISKLKGEEIKLVDSGENSWKIKAGGATVELVLLESSLMEKIKGLVVDSKGWKELPTRFMEGLSLCRFSGNHSQLSGVYVEDSAMVATDEIRINWFDLDKEIDSFWLSDSTTAELLKIPGMTEYLVSDTWVHFKTEDGTIFSCRKLHHAQYPYKKLRGIIDNYAKTKEDISHQLPSGLVEAVDRAATFSMEIQDHPTVRLTFKKEYLEVYAQRSTGKYQEKVLWDEPITEDFEPVVLYVDFSMIAYGLKRSKTFYIREKTKRIVFQGANMIHILSTFEVQQEKGKEK